ncbi:MAG: bile acid:sodium symporter family protein [Beijerinckiaceae bacterium]|jgi:BASS family bile acid:Na+ symporter|nr:bile acid:sodium symporter family protein [Beijerinckiaceae bacterium]
MVGAFEQALLALMIAFIMLGMGASLTLKDFVLALKRPYGLFIGLMSQYGFMPLIAFALAAMLPVSNEIKIGLLIMGCMPGGTTSNIFTYFSKGNLALSVLMTVNSTVFGVLLIPLLLVIYAAGLNITIPAANIVVTLFLLLVPVAIGMALRRWNANIGALVELGGGALGLFFIAFIAVSWVPRNWQFLLGTPPSVFLGAIGLGVIGFLFGYLFSVLLRLHPRNARTIALETGIQNGPLAIAIVALTFSGTQQQAIMAVPALYSLFIVITASTVTLWWRSRVNASEQKLPDSLL